MTHFTDKENCGLLHDLRSEIFDDKNQFLNISFTFVGKDIPHFL